MGKEKTDLVKLVYLMYVIEKKSIEVISNCLRKTYNEIEELLSSTYYVSLKLANWQPAYLSNNKTLATSSNTVIKKITTSKKEITRQAAFKRFRKY